MQRYPDSIRNAFYDLIRSGTTPEDVIELYGIGRGTANLSFRTIQIRDS